MPMHTRDKILQVYVELAGMYERQQDPGMREVFLMLAADAALRADHPAQAESLRQELLRQDPHHVLKPFPSFSEAVQHPDIANYLDDLRQKYPVEVAEDLLESVWPPSTQPMSDVPATLPPQQRQQGPLTPPPARKLPPGTTEKAGEPLKVYRVAPDLEETQPPPVLPPPVNRPPTVPPTRLHPPGQPAPARPAPRQPAARQAAAPRPIGTAPPAARARPPVLRPAQMASPQPAAPLPPLPSATADPEEPQTGGAWVGAILFLVVLAAGVALAMFTLVPYELLRELVQGS
jgi:hypothetical protein